MHIFLFLLGAILTNLNGDVPIETMVDEFKKQFGDVTYALKSLEQGASTTVWAAVAPELEGVGGKYLEDCKISKLSTKEEILKNFFGYLAYSVDKENALKLWNLSLEWIKAKSH